MKSKSEQFRTLLNSNELEFIMEAHNGLSATITERTGFKGIWASGLSISTAMGVRDSNEASWTQVLEVLEFMSDATSVPIMLDGDTGYGNFNNMRRLIQKLEQREVAAVCIEDKTYPKTNSFIGENQKLADIDEFCGKIKAGKDSQLDDAFSIVARIEALIAGWGMSEALVRAEAYHAAGADAILIHSRMAHPDEILTFVKEWAGRCPIVVVPTMYYATPTDVFKDAGVSLVIWANHNMRASIAAMESVSEQIFREESLIGVEHTLPTVKHVFDLMNNQELAEAESHYLPSTKDHMSAVILAASRGIELGALTEEMPKCMLPIRGQPILSRIVDLLKSKDISSMNVVLGYMSDTVKIPGIVAIKNEEYETTSEAYSLSLVAEKLNGPTIVMFGDILFRPYIVDYLREAEGDIVLVVDASFSERRIGSATLAQNLVICSEAFEGKYLYEEEDIYLRSFGDENTKSVHGEWTGLAKLSATGVERVKSELSSMSEDGSLSTALMTKVFQRIVEAGDKISVIYISGHWLDVDNIADLAEAKDFV